MRSMPSTGPDRLVRLPRVEAGPLRLFGRRIAAAVGLITFVALIAYFGRDGYADSDGNGVSLLDAFYYSTVTATTTGYGDIRPESEQARLITTIFVTPARILFLILLVGTTVEILAERTREAFDLRRWRRHLNDHVIICGFGTKGRMALDSLVNHGVERDSIVVIDPTPESLRSAENLGVTAIAGDATRVDILEEAGVRAARSVIVAPQRDDAAVLITLTVRELNPKATIVASVREEENVHLLQQSGADSAIVSSGAAGRLLGMATSRPHTVALREDLLSVGSGLDIVERDVTPDQLGPLDAVQTREPILAVVRGGRMHRCDDREVERLQPGDRLLQLCNRGD
jgi:voltage-gated potassium channel